MAEIVYAKSYTAFAGREAVEVFRAAAICSALYLYAEHGIKANRAYTPKAMMAAAAQITGKKFKARDYKGAHAALKAWVIEQKAKIPAREA